MSALDRKLVRDVMAMKGQVASIALVVASGIAGYIALQSTYASLGASRDTYYARLRFADVFVHLERAPEHVGERLRELPGVAAAETRIVEDVRIPFANVPQPPLGRVVSIPRRGRPAIDDLHLERGRFPEPGRADEALLLEKFAESFGIQPGDVLPVIARGVRREIRITGLAASPEYVYPPPAGGSLSNEERYAVLWMDRDVVARMLGMEGAFNDAVFRLQPEASLARTLGEIDHVLAPWGGLGARGREDQPSHRALSDEMSQLERFATVVPAIFLSVAAFLLNVVLSRVVLLQRGQIAILKALGYGKRALTWHYLGFAVVIVLVGSVLGLALGAWLGRALTGLYARVFGLPEFDYRIGVKTALAATSASFLAASAGALATVRAVLRLPPAEAMRPPSPTRYRPILVDRLGMPRLLQQLERIVARELERKPLRTLLSTAAFATAVAVLVVGRFYLDAIGYVVSFEYGRAEREDLAVELYEPASDRALGELAKFPGVQQVEPMRLVPVRYEHGGRSKEATLIGHPAHPQLRPPLDRYGRPIPLFPGGIVLTKALAEHLGVEPGELVDAEVREGDRRRVRLRVTGLADEFIGLQGHVLDDDLNGLLDENEGVSRILLRIDPEQREPLQRRLDELPAVSAVTSRAANVGHFRRNMGRTMVVMVLVVTAFAATIAAGIVYNNARIALSTGERDLATLRVIGFTRGQISRILLGELALQVLLGIPFGLWFGRLIARWAVGSTETEQVRIPVIIDRQTYAFAVVIAVAAAVLSALLVRRRLQRLDLIAVLKTRE